MNRGLLFLAIAALFFASCRKDHSASTVPSGKKYQVAFNVSNFAQQRASFSLASHALSVKRQARTLAVGDTISLGMNAYLDVLYYYVFDSGGRLVHRVEQDSTMCDQFGLITDSLQNGTYTIIITAGKSGLQESNGAVGTGIAQNYVSYGSVDWQDTFFKSFTINITGTDVNRTVVLNRIVTKLELNILDAIPQNANSITMNVFPEFPEFEFDGTPAGVADSLITTINIPASAKGKTGFTYDKIAGNQHGLFDITIICKDASGHVIGAAGINGVYSGPNEKTILSGNLFSNQPGTGQSFTVKVDTTWAGTTTTTFN